MKIIDETETQKQKNKKQRQKRARATKAIVKSESFFDF